jgi:hypothetical protein
MGTSIGYYGLEVEGAIIKTVLCEGTHKQHHSLHKTWLTVAGQYMQAVHPAESVSHTGPAHERNKSNINKERRIFLSFSIPMGQLRKSVRNQLNKSRN